MEAPDETLKTTAQKIGSFIGRLFVLSVFVAVAAAVYWVAVSVLSGFLPLWAAALLGLPITVLVLAFFIAGESTICEKFMICLQILILSVILLPVFWRAKHNNERLKEMRATQAAMRQRQP